MQNKRTKALFVQRIPIDVYFDLVEVKAHYQCETWIEFFRIVIKKMGDKSTAERRYRGYEYA